MGISIIMPYLRPTCWHPSWIVTLMWNMEMLVVINQLNLKFVMFHEINDLREEINLKLIMSQDEF